ncbi:MAG: hypothetical protein ACJAUV_001261 [Flavobacteriales bacterium]|jgi:hypothetical protein
MSLDNFKAAIQAGIPSSIPVEKQYDTTANHAPKRKGILSSCSAVPARIVYLR